MKRSLALITHLTDLPLPEQLPLPEHLPLPGLYEGSVRASTSLKKAICSWSKLFNILSIDRRSWTFQFHYYRNWSEIDCIHLPSCFLFIASCHSFHPTIWSDKDLGSFTGALPLQTKSSWASVSAVWWCSSNNVCERQTCMPHVDNTCIKARWESNNSKQNCI